MAQAPEERLQAGDQSDTRGFCDLVMKGGITSGVIYPKAILALSRKYRLKNIGGTSAGAIAAGLAAAAEHGGAAGYEKLGKIPDHIATTLLEKFQPEPKLAPLFNLLLASLKGGCFCGRAKRFLLAVFGGYWRRLAVWAGGPLVAAIVFGAFCLIGWMAFALVLTVLGCLVGLGLGLWRDISKTLPAHNFGVCSGRTVPGAEGPALTDWLDVTLNDIAGIPGKTSCQPLTFGRLRNRGKEHAIELAVMTTDLSSRRPYRLPFQDKAGGSYETRHAFKESEFRALFPDYIVDYLITHGERLSPSEDLYYLPDAEHFPVLVAVRMSLSFPGLLQAVPLYRKDLTREDPAEQETLRRCLFSDGGLSSNFPIHFFDSLLPSHPTFAINLEAYDKTRWPADSTERTRLEKQSCGGNRLPIYEINGFPHFLMTLLDAAKDWQDNLQRMLPGYRERVVHVALTSDEGGMNLTMDDETIKKLSSYGENAAERLLESFDFDEHRRLRFIVAMGELEELVETVRTSYTKCGDGKQGIDIQCDEGIEGLEEFIKKRGDSKTCPQGEECIERMLERAKDIVALGEKWSNTKPVRDCNIPEPKCDMTLTPKK